MYCHFFAASNSAEGFKSYYPEIFARADLLYVIKGGPGTGKSSFMKKHAMRAENLGYRCEYYHCSSDPSSLDGVLIFSDGGVTGFLDGTPPHVCEPRLPGAREEIVNLGEYWDGEILRRQKNEIRALNERKSAEYKSAYTYLRSVGNLRAVTDGLLNDVILWDKMRTAAEKLVREYPNGKMRSVPAIVDSVSMCGQVRLDSLEQNAKEICVVSDFYGVGGFFLGAVAEALEKKCVSLRISYDPVRPDKIYGIFVEESETAFLVAQSGDRFDDFDAKYGKKINTSVNSKRFVDTERLKDVRSELRYTARLAQSSLDGALHSLSKARIYHFLLEDIYYKAMDFQKMSEIKVDIL